MFKEVNMGPWECSLQPTNFYKRCILTWKILTLLSIKFAHLKLPNPVLTFPFKIFITSKKYKNHFNKPDLRRWVTHVRVKLNSLNIKISWLGGFSALLSIIAMRLAVASTTWKRNLTNTWKTCCGHVIWMGVFTTTNGQGLKSPRIRLTRPRVLFHQPCSNFFATFAKLIAKIRALHMDCKG